MALRTLCNHKFQNQNVFERFKHLEKRVPNGANNVKDVTFPFDKIRGIVQ